MDQLLTLVFPTIYGKGSQQDHIAQQIFLRIIQFLQNDSQFFKDQRQKTFLLDRLTKASPDSKKGSLKIIFMCKYACAIVIKKRTQQSSFLIQIIAPQQWGSGTHNWEMINMEFCQPKDKKTHYMPQVQQNQYSITKFVQNFEVNLKLALKILPKQFSAKSIHKACKIVSQMSRPLTSSIQKSNEQQQNEQKAQIKSQQVETGVQSIILIQSHANTSWYVPEAVIKDLIKRHSDPSMKPSIQKLIIYFKGYLLKQVTTKRAEQKKYNQIQVLNFKRCLDELIHKYKQHISIDKASVANRIEDFSEFIKIITKNLKIITNNGVTSKINDIDEVIGSLPFKKPQNPTINCIDKQQHLPSQIVLAEINDYPMKVDSRLPFEKLLQIGEYIQQSSFQQQSKWILLTERTLFALSQQFVNDNTIIDLNIHLRQIECQIGASNLCLLVKKYEQIIIINPHHFGMGMQGQSKSHIKLIKYIAALIAFQSVKMNRQRKKSNLNDYRVSLNIENLYKGFISHSYEARKAMKNILTYYNYRKQKLPIFMLNGKSNSFQQFARLAAQQTRTAKIWSDNMKKYVDLKKQNTYQKIKLQQAVQIKNKIIDNFNYLRNNTYSIENYRNQAITSSQPSIITQFNQNDQYLFAFLQNIPIDVLGLMKILYMAQNPQKADVNLNDNLFDQHFVNEQQQIEQQLSIKIYSQRPAISTNFYNSGTVTKQTIVINNNYSEVKILFQDCSHGTDLNPNLFQTYGNMYQQANKNYEFKQKLQYLLKRPIDQKYKDRQHRLYARQNDKPQQIQIDDFLAIGNVRSAQYTQLMVLCYNIYQRKIISNSYDNVCKLAEQLILQTAGQLSIYEPKVQRQFKQITKLIQQFIKVWSFTDVNFCPILAPF